MPGKDLADHRQQVVDFGVGGDRFIGIVEADVGGADHDAVKKWQDQHDAAVVILEEDSLSRAAASSNCG